MDAKLSAIQHAKTTVKKTALVDAVVHHALVVAHRIALTSVTKNVVALPMHHAPAVTVNVTVDAKVRVKEHVIVDVKDALHLAEKTVHLHALVHAAQPACLHVKMDAVVVLAPVLAVVLAQMIALKDVRKHVEVTVVENVVRGASPIVHLVALVHAIQAVLVDAVVVAQEVVIQAALEDALAVLHLVKVDALDALDVVAVQLCVKITALEDALTDAMVTVVRHVQKVAQVLALDATLNAKDALALV